ncbi:hypothetical protein K6U61_10370 [Vibrio vulnificus]|nr:hypothetical protein [Vibrio vulnificus]
MLLVVKVVCGKLV